MRKKYSSDGNNELGYMGNPQPNFFFFFYIFFIKNKNKKKKKRRFRDYNQLGCFFILNKIKTP